MLVLSRKAGESIQIGDSVKLVINRISGNRVTIGIEAPNGIRILRGELAQAANAFNEDVPKGDVPKGDVPKGDASMEREDPVNRSRSSRALNHTRISETAMEPEKQTATSIPSRRARCEYRPLRY
jgi:carbon storage regulator